MFFQLGIIDQTKKRNINLVWKIEFINFFFNLKKLRQTHRWWVNAEINIWSNLEISLAKAFTGPRPSRRRAWQGLLVKNLVKKLLTKGSFILLIEKWTLSSLVRSSKHFLMPAEISCFWTALLRQKTAIQRWSRRATWESRRAFGNQWARKSEWF